MTKRNCLLRRENGPPRRAGQVPCVLPRTAGSLQGDPVGVWGWARDTHLLQSLPAGRAALSVPKECVDRAGPLRAGF